MPKRSKAQVDSKIRVEGLSVVEPNAAGIDIGAEEHWVAVPPHLVKSESVRTFSAFSEGLNQLADWLVTLGITTAAMESTGVYWVPLYELLEARGIKVCLVNARHVKNVPGRKTDVKDCQWLQKLHSFGLLQASFRPGAAFVQLRTYLRHRGNLMESASHHIQHMQKALTLMNVQLHHAVSDITGVTGMAIIRQIVAGNHDAAKLAKLRDARCEKTEAEIEAALRGQYREGELLVLRHAVELYDSYQDRLAECDEAIKKQLEVLRRTIDVEEVRKLPQAKTHRKKKRTKEFVHDVREQLFQIARGVDLTQVPGLGQLTALQLLSEIGTDMSRWPTEHHFVSWATLAPSNRITGGKRYASRRPASAHRVAQILRMAAMNAGKTSTAIGAFFRRMSIRIGTPKAIVATAAKLARLIHKMLRDQCSYVDPGIAAYEQAQRDKYVRTLKRRAAALGMALIPAPSPLVAITTG
jgi:transposase